MRTVLVQYTTHADKTDENEALIHQVFNELRATKPAGLRYATFRVADGSGFVHLATVDTADGNNPLFALETFKRFSGTIEERCAVEPVSKQLVPVDSYGF